MNDRTDMDSINRVMEYLEEKGFDNEFQITPAGDMHLLGNTYSPDKVKLIRTFRFEGETDPSEQCIIYLVETSDGNTGYSKDSYGMYSQHLNDAYADFINHISSS
jgi:hypothetical protein